MIKCKIEACVFILPIFRNYTTDPFLLTQPSVTGYKGSNAKHLVCFNTRNNILFATTMYYEIYIYCLFKENNYLVNRRVIIVEHTISILFVILYN